MADFFALERQNRLPPGLLNAVMRQESGGNPNAVSPKGALGAFQFMPATAQQYGINPLDPEQAAQGAAKMYGELLQKYNGDLPSALAAYNWGQGNVDRKGLQNAPAETRNYIASISQALQAPQTQTQQLPTMSSDVSYAEMGQGEPEYTDAQLEAMSDEELARIAGVDPVTLQPLNQTQAAPAAEQDYTDAELEAMSDEELARIAGVDPVTLQPLDQQNGAPSAGLSADPQEPGLFDRIGQDIDTRSQTAADAILASQGGEQTGLEGAFQVAGQGAGLLGDAAGEVLSSVAGLVPDSVKQAAVSGINKLTSVVPDSQAQGIQKALDKGGSALASYGEWAKENPRAGRNLAAVGNLAALGASLTPIGSGRSVVGRSVAAGSKVPGLGEKAAQNAIKTAVYPVASPVGGVRNMVKGATARNVDELEEATKAIKARSSDAYNQMRNSGATFTPEATATISQNIGKALQEDGILNPRLHDKTIGLFEDFQDAAKAAPLELESLDQWRQLFGEVAGNFNDPINQRKASIAIRAIDDAVEKVGGSDLVNGSREAVDALKLGRQEYARARKFETISDIVKKSEGDANYLKRELKKIANDKKKSRGFSPDELKALKEASTLTFGEGLLKLMGKFGFDPGGSRLGSGVGAGFGALLGSTVSGVPGAVIAPTVGTASRYGQKLIARGKTEKLLQTIEAKPPKTAGEALKNYRGSK